MPNTKPKPGDKVRCANCGQKTTVKKVEDFFDNKSWWVTMEPHKDNSNLNCYGGYRVSK